MCEFCFETEKYRFTTLSEFENFEKELFLKDKNLSVLKATKEFSTGFYTSYKCNSCSEIWYLSEPENSWRGYLLKEDSAKIYIDKIKKNDLKKKYGCFFFLIVFLILILFFEN